MADKPIISSRGLDLVYFEKKHVIPVAVNLSDENLRELDVIYQVEPVQALYERACEVNTFAIERHGEPVAVTGYSLCDDHIHIWAVFTKEMRKQWVRFARASHDLMSFYSQLRPTMICDVWSENEMIIQWLLHLGFDAETVLTDSNGNRIVRFVRCDYEDDSVVNTAQRPAIH
jgi:hypothetical protein